MLIELKKNEPTSDNQFFRLAILMYEMGDINRSIVYYSKTTKKQELLIWLIGWDFNELRKLTPKGKT